MRLIKLLANMAYGSRKEVASLFRDGYVTDPAGNPIGPDAVIAHADIRLDGKPLDPAFGLVLMLNKPLGYVCSTKDQGRLVYDLLPRRFRVRKPVVSPVGRLDKETSGLLLFTDDGALLHRITSRHAQVPKVYEVTLARPLTGAEAPLFAAGTLVLNSETDPLAPAFLTPTGERSATLTLYEGRYHQVRRMFAAVGNHVETLHRASIGGLTLGTLAPGEWRVLAEGEVNGVFAG